MLSSIKFNDYHFTVFDFSLSFDFELDFLTDFFIYSYKFSSLFSFSNLKVPFNSITLDNKINSIKLLILQMTIFSFQTFNNSFIMIHCEFMLILEFLSYSLLHHHNFIAFLFIELVFLLRLQ